MLVVGQRTQIVIRADECGNTRVVQRRLADRGPTPIVDGDREVVRKKIGRRETEVDDAGDASVLKQDVVAEQVSVDRAFRQRALAVSGLKLELRGQQLLLLRRQKGLHDARRLAPPRWTAAID